MSEPAEPPVTGALVQGLLESQRQTTDALVENLQAQLDDMAQALHQIGRVLEDATVIDRATERRLRYYDGAIAAARDHLDRRAGRS
jgi:hypothetical protein